MTQFDRSQGPESHEPDTCRADAEPEGSGPNQTAPVPEARPEELTDPSAPPPPDWTAAAREVLQGLAEEVPDDMDHGSQKSDATAQDQPSITARRTNRPRERCLTRTRPSRPSFTLNQRLLILDAWSRSGLPGSEFAPLVGVSPHTLYCWRRAFEQEGPAGLVAKPRGAPAGSRLPEVTKRAILLMKQDHPEWGCQRISDLLMRGPALGASASAVAKVLHEAGYEFEEVPTRPHAPEVHRFERARPNQLWQSDLFTFILKRQNRRVYLVGFMDDHSRFITSYGLHASQSSALVIEVLRAGIASYGLPEEILTDNGSQYVTWRGKSAFSRELDKLGIRQVVAARKHPQTLGKIERFWGTLWRECLEGAIFQDLGDARRRIGLFLDYYNFQRTNLGIDGLVPADRFFGAASEVLRTLRARVAANSLELARRGLPKAPFYLTGQVGGKGFSIHAAGERVILTDATGAQREIELVAPQDPKPTDPAQSPTIENAPSPAIPSPPPQSLPEPICPDGSPGEQTTASDQADPIQPGTSLLDNALDRLAQGLAYHPAKGNHTPIPPQPPTPPDSATDEGGVQ
jgi:transposase InsO family protein